MRLQYILKLICVVAAANLFLPLFSQNDSAMIRLRAYPDKESVKLRWAVTTPLVWKNTLSTGFILERYTVVRNGVRLEEREKKILTPQPLLPLPLNKWEALAGQNSYAAVLAQALYGEDFEVTGLESNDIATILNLSEELEQRYSFALYSADMCFECACMAGWGYEDKEVVKGEYYLYKVMSAGPDSLGYGSDYTSIDEYYELPQPVDLMAQFGDKSVQLSWNASLFSDYFTSYQVEKSEDNIHFEKSGLPVTPFNGEIKGYTLYIDSLSENDRTYYYRIRGISPFGLQSEPSDVVSGKGIKSWDYTPVIVETKIDTSNRVHLRWEFDLLGNEFIRSFELKRSARESGPYEYVLKDIPKEDRTLAYKDLLPTNYFILEAVGANGKRTASYPVLVMPVDSFPPAAPVGLTARADTSGRVYLQWTPNTEPDMLGYKIFRGNVKGEELIALNEIPVEDHTYIDSIDLYQLNPGVFYSLIALDQRYNQSGHSEILQVERPLKVKPSPPLFSGFESGHNGIFLNWIHSPGKEVARHTLYRQHIDSIQKIAIAVFENDTASSFTDTGIIGGSTYLYTITATSKWGVESDPSPEYRIGSLPEIKPGLIRNLKAHINPEKQQVELSWKIDRPEKVGTWKIYKAENENPVALWKELPAGESTVADASLKVGSVYKYLIWAELKDGGISRHEEIIVNY